MGLVVVVLVVGTVPLLPNFNEALGIGSEKIDYLKDVRGT